MDNSVGDIYIKEIVEKAVEYFGIKKSVEKREVCPEGLMDEGSIKGCIKNIARKLGLDINVKLLYVEDSYFSSKSLVWKNGETFDTVGITAQVLMPERLPFFGSSELANFPIEVAIAKNSQQEEYSFITIMVHELSHVLLKSLMQDEWSNEFYTDITAIVLGFLEIMEYGRKRSVFSGCSKVDITYGYLNDSQFVFVKKEIEKIITNYGRAVKAKNYQTEEIYKIASVLKNIINKSNVLKKYFEQNFRVLNSEKDYNIYKQLIQFDWENEKSLLSKVEDIFKKDDILVENTVITLSNIKSINERVDFLQKLKEEVGFHIKNEKNNWVADVFNNVKEEHFKLIKKIRYKGELLKNQLSDIKKFLGDIKYILKTFKFNDSRAESKGGYLETMIKMHEINCFEDQFARIEFVGNEVEEICNSSEKLIFENENSRERILFWLNEMEIWLKEASSKNKLFSSGKESLLRNLSIWNKIKFWYNNF